MLHLDLHCSQIYYLLHNFTLPLLTCALICCGLQDVEFWDTTAGSVCSGGWTVAALLDATVEVMLQGETASLYDGGAAWLAEEYKSSYEGGLTSLTRCTGGSNT